MFLANSELYLSVIKHQWRVIFVVTCMWKHISMTCLPESELNNIFHWKTQLLTVFKLLLSQAWEKVLPLTFKKCYVSSANILNIDLIPLGNSVISIKIEEVPTQNPVELQSVYFFTKKFDHLKQPFVDELLK